MGIQKRTGKIRRKLLLLVRVFGRALVGLSLLELSDREL